VLSKKQLFSKSIEKGADILRIPEVSENPATGEPGTESSPLFSANSLVFFGLKNAGFKNE
jgi:hypothetical protein